MSRDISIEIMRLAYMFLAALRESVETIQIDKKCLVDEIIVVEHYFQISLYATLYSQCCIVFLLQ
jgi:hypothetical protein